MAALVVAFCKHLSLRNSLLTWLLSGACLSGDIWMTSSMATEIEEDKQAHSRNFKKRRVAMCKSKSVAECSRLYMPVLNPHVQLASIAMRLNWQTRLRCQLRSGADQAPVVSMLSGTSRTNRLIDMLHPH